MIFVDDLSRTLPKRHSVIKNIFLNCPGLFIISKKVQKYEISRFVHYSAYNERTRAVLNFFVTACIFGGVLESSSTKTISDQYIIFHSIFKVFFFFVDRVGVFFFLILNCWWFCVLSFVCFVWCAYRYLYCFDFCFSFRLTFRNTVIE